MSERLRLIRSQSLSGWDGVFPRGNSEVCGMGSSPVAIPFRVGWGFSLFEDAGEVFPAKVAIPFRVGWGFSYIEGWVAEVRSLESQSLSGWDGVFPRFAKPPQKIFFDRSQSLSGWDGVFPRPEA